MSHFDQSLCWAQILILKIRTVSLGLKFSPALILTKLKRFETGSPLKRYLSCPGLELVPAPVTECGLGKVLTAAF
jgi:hypothetical protein